MWGLPATLPAALRTILCRAFLNLGSEHSFTTKPWPRSRRSGRWWGPSPGTPWRRPARGSGPGLRISSMLMTVLLNKWILSMFLCQPVFYLIIWFSAVLCHLQKTWSKFRIYRCHPVYSVKKSNCCVLHQIICPDCFSYRFSPTCPVLGALPYFSVVVIAVCLSFQHIFFLVGFSFVAKTYRYVFFLSVSFSPTRWPTFGCSKCPMLSVWWLLSRLSSIEKVLTFLLPPPPPVT